ncbi:Dr1 associated protein 1 (negative cofactor 2 alpha), isoform CRA_a [Mus musculus]|nr:Dr1 associated protein 1 (negative cofactor 2 alpha), isoform CRA_a [Mus musculus]
MGPGPLINPDPFRALRMSLRIQILMGKKRHHSFHPKPVTLLPTFRAPPGPSAADAEDEEDYDS